MRGYSLQCQLHLACPHVVWVVSYARLMISAWHGASSVSGWKRRPPDTAGSWEYIYRSSNCGWMVDRLGPPAEAFRRKQPFIVNSNRGPLWREDSMNVRQYCGPRHRNARRCKIVRHSWLIFGRFGVRILIQRYWQVFVGLNTPIRKIIESASQATIASFHILSNSLFMYRP